MALALAGWGGLACGPTIGSGDGGGDGGGDGDSDVGPATTSAADASESDSMTPTADTGSPATTSPTGPDTTAGATSDTSNTTDADSTGGAGTCPIVPTSSCAEPFDCEAVSCGAFDSWIDPDGCVRAPCSTKGTCPDNGICFEPRAWGGCTPSAQTCQDRDGACTCTSTPDCGGTFCVPDGQAPPTACYDLDTEESCIDSGCGPFLEGRPVVTAGAGCLCDLAQSYCVWVRADATVTAAQPTAYANLVDGSVVVFDDAYDPPPAGYEPCASQAFPSPECLCAAMLPCAM